MTRAAIEAFAGGTTRWKAFSRPRGRSRVRTFARCSNGDAKRVEIGRFSSGCLSTPRNATWTYGAFIDRVERFGAGLSARGVRPGDRVLVHMENSPEFLVAWLGCAAAGVVAVTTNARSTADELKYYCGDAGAVAAVTQPKFAEMVASACEDLGWIATTASDAGSTPSGAPPRSDRFDAIISRSRRRLASAARSRRAVLRAVHVGDHLQTQGRRLDPRQCALGRSRQRGARRLARGRRIPDDDAALSHQRAGLLGARELSGRGRRSCCNRVFRLPGSGASR